jgi:heat shock protein HslJ
VLIVAGCGRDASAQWPAGQRFLSTSIVEHGVPRQPVGGARIELAFSDRGLVAYAGCNHFGGDARLEGGQLTFDTTSSNAMACSKDVMEQEQWLYKFLSSRPSLRISGNELVLRNADIEMRLANANLG